MYGLFGAQVIALDGTSPSFEIEIQHKNHDDLTFSPADNFSSMTTPGLYTKDAGPLKEQLRLKINVGGGASMNTVYALILAPMWRQNP